MKFKVSVCKKKNGFNCFSHFLCQAVCCPHSNSFVVLPTSRASCSWGLLGILLLEKWLASWFLVYWFLRLWFLGLLVSRVSVSLFLDFLVCWFSWFQNVVVSGFLVLKCLGFSDYWFLGFTCSWFCGFKVVWFLISWFIGFKVSKFLGFKVHWSQSFNDPILQISISCVLEDIDPTSTDRRYCSASARSNMFYLLDVQHSEIPKTIMFQNCSIINKQ